MSLPDTTTPKESASKEPALVEWETPEIQELKTTDTEGGDTAISENNAGYFSS